MNGKAAFSAFPALGGISAVAAWFMTARVKRSTVSWLLLPAISLDKGANMVLATCSESERGAGERPGERAAVGGKRVVHASPHLAHV